MIIDKAVIDVFSATLQVGSQTILDAATPQSDYDVLCYTWCKWLAVKRLNKLGYFRTVAPSDVPSPYRYNQNIFVTMRGPDKVNLIITSSHKFYNRFSGANRVAQRLQLTEKEDRIVLFQYILYGRHWPR
jgi:hypothetical protein